MFKSAVVKLTLLYLAIIAVICLYFSLNLYDISTKELERGLRAQQKRLNRPPREVRIVDDEGEIENELEDVLDLGQNRIVSRLVVANVAILAIGGLGSYLLAKRTLDPIEKAHEAQKRFTADASHELRTPLATMQAEIEIALRDKKLSLPDSKKILTSNLEELQDLTQLSDSLLKLAREDNELDLQPTNLNKVIKAAEKRVKRQYLNIDKNFTVHNNYATDINVQGEHDALVNLFIILFDNTIKYCAESVVVDIDAKARKNNVEICIADNGPGIKQQDLPYIFERFYQGDASRKKAKSSGHGLGLSIAKQIVDLHHGSIFATSELGKGTKFFVKLLLS